MHKPVEVGPFGLSAENGIDDPFLELKGVVGLGEVYGMGGKLGYTGILAQVFKQGQVLLHVHEIEEAIGDLAGAVPHIHGKDKAEFKYQEEQPLDDLYRIGNKE